MKNFKEVVELFDFSIEQMIDQIIIELSSEIIELNQIEQLQEGVDAFDQRIITISAEEQDAGNVYSFKAIQERNIRGLQVDNVDLNFTGDFWRTFRVTKVAGGWEVQADYNLHGDDIRENFDLKYDFLGLTENNLEVLIYGSVLPMLEKKIRARLKI